MSIEPSPEFSISCSISSARALPVWRFERSRKKDDPTCVFKDCFQSSGYCGLRGGPYQEHRLDAIERSNECVGRGEISSDHLDPRRQTSRLRLTGQDAHLPCAPRPAN